MSAISFLSSFTFWSSTSSLQLQGHSTPGPGPWGNASYIFLTVFFPVLTDVFLELRSLCLGHVPTPEFFL